MLVRVLLAAILAGVAGGVFATAAQSVKVIPIILEAENYESGASHSHGGAPASGAQDGHDHAAHDHAANDHAATAGDDGEWAPNEGWERTAFTLLANVVVGVGFSLIVTAAIVLVGVSVTPLTGLAWGLAGFMTFVLAPNLGLPPELPGTVAAELLPRQMWWFATVAATAGGLAIFALRRHPLLMLAGVGLIAAPHLYGAPKPDSHESLAPAHLAVDFAVASIATSFVYWLFLGALLGFLLDRAMRAERAAEAA